eukprot:4831158-Karenia_brevis.AAC.1
MEARVCTSAFLCGQQKAGQTAPRAAEAFQMLKEMKEKRTQEQIAATEASLDWVPMILGDGPK